MANDAYWNAIRILSLDFGGIIQALIYNVSLNYKLKLTESTRLSEVKFHFDANKSAVFMNKAVVICSVKQEY